jgi:hypothetical protein
MQPLSLFFRVLLCNPYLFFWVLCNPYLFSCGYYATLIYFLVGTMQPSSPFFWVLYNPYFLSFGYYVILISFLWVLRNPIPCIWGTTQISPRLWYFASQPCDVFSCVWNPLPINGHWPFFFRLGTVPSKGFNTFLFRHKFLFHEITLRLV